MGGIAEDKFVSSVELPRHQVTLNDSFALGTAPVIAAPVIAAPKVDAPQMITPKPDHDKRRYGESVVREILGASFIEELAVAPRVAPKAD